jgi:hypothetical protein
MYASGDYSLLDSLPTLDASESALPSAHLARAAVVLGNVAHSAYYFSPQHRNSVPDCILEPWRTVTRRLGRPTPSLSYLDLFLHNWRRRDDDDAAVTITPQLCVQQDLEVMVPVFEGYGEREEHVFNLAMVDMHARSASLVKLVLDAQTAVLLGLRCQFAWCAAGLFFHLALGECRSTR